MRKEARGVLTFERVSDNNPLPLWVVFCMVNLRTLVGCTPHQCSLGVGSKPPLPRHMLKCDIPTTHNNGTGPLPDSVTLAGCGGGGGGLHPAATQPFSGSSFTGGFMFTLMLIGVVYVCIASCRDGEGPGGGPGGEMGAAPNGWSRSVAQKASLNQGGGYSSLDGSTMARHLDQDER